MGQEPQEKQGLIPKIEDLSRDYIERSGQDFLVLDPEVVGAKMWHEMIKKTQEDFKERGLIITRKRNGNLATSPIFIDEGEEAYKKVSTPIPIGLKTILLGRKEVTFVHTHPMPPDVNHLRTTVFSDEDLRVFFENDYRASVMLDRGGAHLLVRTGYQFRSLEKPPKNLMSDVIEQVKRQSGGTYDIIRESAKILNNQGVGYFFTSDLNTTGKSAIKFLNPKNL